MLLHCLLAYVINISDKKSNVTFTFVLLCVIYDYFPLVAFKIVSLSLILCNLIMMFLGVVFFLFLMLRVCSAYNMGKFWPLFLQIYFLCLPFFRGTNYTYIRLLEGTPQLTDAHSVLFKKIFLISVFQLE